MLRPHIHNMYASHNKVSAHTPAQGFPSTAEEADAPQQQPSIFPS